MTIFNFDVNQMLYSYQTAHQNTPFKKNYLESIPQTKIVAHMPHVAASIEK